jgi:hypothetical protein
VTSPQKPARKRSRSLTLDQAIIAVLIAAMEANRHVSAEEAERAHHLIWFMRRFRRKSGTAVAKLIGIVRERMERDGIAGVLEQAAHAIPADLRPSVFATAVDLMLADTRLQAVERRFITQLAGRLNVPQPLASDILRVMLIKNGA